MPIYEYKCSDCMSIFEVRFLSTIDDNDGKVTIEMIANKPRKVARTNEIPYCPECGSSSVKRRFGTFNFKI